MKVLVVLCGLSPYQPPQDLAAAVHADEVKLIEQTQHDISQPILAGKTPGLAERQAAEARILASQGLNVHRTNEAWVAQTESQLLATQQQYI